MPSFDARAGPVHEYILSGRVLDKAVWVSRSTQYPSTVMHSWWIRLHVHIDQKAVYRVNQLRSDISSDGRNLSPATADVSTSPWYRPNFWCHGAWGVVSGVGLRQPTLNHVGK